MRRTISENSIFARILRKAKCCEDPCLRCFAMCRKGFFRRPCCLSLVVIDTSCFLTRFHHVSVGHHIHSGTPNLSQALSGVDTCNFIGYQISPESKSESVVCIDVMSHERSCRRLSTSLHSIAHQFIDTRQGSGYNHVVAIQRMNK